MANDIPSRTSNGIPIVVASINSGLHQNVSRGHILIEVLYVSTIYQSPHRLPTHPVAESRTVRGRMSVRWAPVPSYVVAGLRNSGKKPFGS